LISIYPVALQGKICTIVSSGLLTCVFGKNLANDDEHRDIYLSKKRKAVWATLHAIIALIGTKAGKPTLLSLNFEHDEENFYSFSILQDTTWQFNHLLPPSPLPPPLLGYWLPD
jgi:hypothetical protein